MKQVTQHNRNMYMLRHALPSIKPNKNYFVNNMHLKHTEEGYTRTTQERYILCSQICLMSDVNKRFTRLQSLLQH